MFKKTVEAATCYYLGCAELSLSLWTSHIIHRSMFRHAHSGNRFSDITYVQHLIDNLSNSSSASLRLG